MSAKANLVRRAPAERIDDVVPLQEKTGPGRPRNSHDDLIIKILRQHSDIDWIWGATARIIIDYYRTVRKERLDHKRALTLARDHMRKHYRGTLPRPKTGHVDGQRIVVPEPPGGQELKREWRELSFERAHKFLRENKFF